MFIKRITIIFLGLVCLVGFGFGQTGGNVQAKQDPLKDSVEKYKALKQNTKALSFCIQLLHKTKSEMGETQEEYADAQNLLGETYRRLGKLDSAGYWLKKGLGIQQNRLGTENAKVATLINNLGILYLSLTQLKLADSCLRNAWQIRTRVLGEENTFTATSLHNMGQLFFTKGQTDSAEIFYKKALAIRLKLLGEIHEDVAATMNNMVNVYREVGSYNLAEPLILKVIEIRKKLFGPEHILVGMGYYNLATVFLDAGDYTRSESNYIQAIAICTKALGPDHSEMGDIYINTGGLYYRKGDFSKAEELYQKALAIKEKDENPDKESVVALYTNMGNLAIELGNPKKAIILNLKALEIGEAIFGPNHLTICNIYGNLGIAYSNIGQLKTSNAYHEKSIAGIIKTFGSEHNELGGSYICLGTNLEAMGRIQDAISMTNKALQNWQNAFGNWHPKLADVFTNLGYLNEIKGEFKLAEAYYAKSIEIQLRTLGSRHPDLGMNYHSLGILNMKKGLYAKAEPFFQKSTLNWNNQIAQWFPTLSADEKEQLYNKLTFQFQNFGAFALKSSLSNPALLGTLFNQQLAIKGLLLSSSQKFKSQLENTSDTALSARYKKWESLTNQIAAYYTSPDSTEQAELSGLIAEAEELEKELARKWVQFDGLKKTKQVLWTDIRSKLKPGEAAIEMIRLEKFGINRSFIDSSDKRMPRYSLQGLTDTAWYAALIVKANSKHPDLVLLKNGNLLENKWIQVYKNQIRTRQDDKVSYNEFWKKIDSRLGPEVKRVYFSPDGVYNSINLNTLQNPKSGKYLLEERNIQLLTNTKEILTAGLQIGETNYACLVGYPEYSASNEVRKAAVQRERNHVEPAYILPLTRGDAVGELPGTKIEVEGIADILKSHGWKIDEYLGERALEELIKDTDKPRILHIATHGYFQADTTSGRNPLVNSGLLFAGANQTLMGVKNTDMEDGILTAYEAMNLNLDNTDLVVLSACETGLGEIKNGEGVYGLQRAFKVAGAKSIIMSLWKVSDQATQELMVSFYKNWLRPQTPEGGLKGKNTSAKVALSPPSGDLGGRSLKRQAFLKAQKELKAKYPEPYYWGAFVMVGE